MSENAWKGISQSMLFSWKDISNQISNTSHDKKTSNFGYWT